MVPIVEARKTVRHYFSPADTGHFEVMFVIYPWRLTSDQLRSVVSTTTAWSHTYGISPLNSLKIFSFSILRSGHGLAVLYYAVRTTDSSFVSSSHEIIVRPPVRDHLRVTKPFTNVQSSNSSLQFENTHPKRVVGLTSSADGRACRIL